MIALFLALGGGAYAATQLARNSVGSQQIKTGSIRIGARDRAQAVGYAYRRGLVAQDG